MCWPPLVKGCGVNGANSPTGNILEILIKITPPGRSPLTASANTIRYRIVCMYFGRMGVWKRFGIIKFGFFMDGCWGGCWRCGWSGFGYVEINNIDGIDEKWQLRIHFYEINIWKRILKTCWRDCSYKTKRFWLVKNHTDEHPLCVALLN